MQGWEREASYKLIINNYSLYVNLVTIHLVCITYYKLLFTVCELGHNSFGMHKIIELTIQ